ncbi:hypothetical protein NLU13_4743 [Sarocladium strictum]|uniref:Uncharacterized protein n=1 Tax=Sarocladium strictum TaxID=5046 RepID=A0AA39GJG7_SARSR|nr:hypothetical protein NLU13_4743 [Sarocladium strictum]
MVNLATLQYGRFRYNSPWTQVVIVGVIAFCSVGMFSALSNLGAGGTQDVHLSNIANSTLYGCFFIGGFFAGSINNTLGPRLTMSIGTTGYALYVGAVWNFQVSGNQWFFILAGGILGLTASLFWAAQGSVMMSYPMEKDKGRSFSVFWGLFQMGTLIGASITLGIQANSTMPSVSTAVYIVFLIIMLIAIGLSWLVLPPHLVVRGDRTLVEVEASLTPREEFNHFVDLFKDWRMLALFPMFFSSNYFYAYQNALTAALFNGRTRALVALLTGLGSIVGSILIGLLTDTLPLSRRYRAFASSAVVFTLMCAVWGGGLGFQVQFDRSSTEVLGQPIPWDWTVGSAIGPIILMMSYYIVDASWQGLAYYTMSSITNNPFRLARMAGYYKAIQSAGAAVSFGMEAAKAPYLAEHLISWLLVLLSMPFCALVLYKIRETNYGVEEAVTVDETDATAKKVDGKAVDAAEDRGDE